MPDHLVESLLSPAAYPQLRDREAVEFHQTHISWVFLAGEFAWKVKRPVNFGFLDFSTLELRKHYCEEELRLNGRLAPHLYLEVVPIGPAANDPDRLVVGGQPPVEYAVKMRRFPQEAILLNVLKRGELTPEHVDTLAAVVAEFHAGIQRASVDSEFGRPASVIEPVLECIAPAAGDPSDSAEQEQLARLRQWVEAEHVSRFSLFEVRREAGFIRECHGDVHLGNVLLEGPRVTLFDGIEFSERLRWIDVLSEVAFTRMDLSERGRPDLAARFLNAYLQHTGDYAGLGVLRFYTVYRALVRAKVAGIRLREIGLSADERQAQDAERRGYLALATSLTQPVQPQVIITHGLSGSGKSTATQPLLEGLPAIRIRSDVERKRMSGLKASESSRSSLGSGLYTSGQTTGTYNRLAELARQVVSSGYNVMVDATFLKRCQRQQFQDLAQELGAAFSILDFDVPVETLRDRVAARQQQGGDPSEATLEVLEEQIQTREPLAAEERTFVAEGERLAR